ncbi:MAG: hypothetical protein FWF27_06925, partial [Candidatus Bathyarchaeota archaeon]|nr:hypothetical protein [Candidatus Termiticorpusculum sp.]
NYEVKQFEAVGNLGSLGLGYFNDITVPIYRGGFEIIFTRNNGDNVIYRWKVLKADGTEDASTLPPEGKIVIKELFDESYYFQLKKMAVHSTDERNRKNFTFSYYNYL